MAKLSIEAGSLGAHETGTAVPALAPPRPRDPADAPGEAGARRGHRLVDRVICAGADGATAGPAHRNPLHRPGHEPAAHSQHAPRVGFRSYSR